MVTNEQIVKALLECEIIIKNQQQSIKKKLKKEAKSKLKNGSIEYIQALNDLNENFNKILEVIKQFTVAPDKLYFIDALREKYRVIFLQYNHCSDYLDEKNALEKSLALLLPFISDTQKEIEKVFSKNIKGVILYDTAFFCFEAFSNELKDYISLPIIFHDFSAEETTAHCELTQLSKKIKLCINLLTKVKSPEQFYQSAYQFLNAKKHAKKLMQILDSSFNLNCLTLDEEFDTQL